MTSAETTRKACSPVQVAETWQGTQSEPTLWKVALTDALGAGSDLHGVCKKGAICEAQ